MRYRLNKQSVEWLRDNRVYFEGNDNFRLRAGDIINLPPAPRIEPYAAFFSGFHLHNMGSFSYSHSSLPTDATVGRYCSISWDVKSPGPRHPLELLSTSAFMIDRNYLALQTFLNDTGSQFDNYQQNPQKRGPVIGNDVWIGQNASIMRGISIGNGAVIGASAVVTKDVPPYAVAAGNPARIVKYRFTPDVVEALERIRWWRFSFAHFSDIDLSDVGRSLHDLDKKIALMDEYQPRPIDFANMPNAGSW